MFKKCLIPTHFSIQVTWWNLSLANRNLLDGLGAKHWFWHTKCFGSVCNFMIIVPCQMQFACLLSQNLPSSNGLHFSSASFLSCPDLLKAKKKKLCNMTYKLIYYRGQTFSNEEKLQGCNTECVLSSEISHLHWQNIYSQDSLSYFRYREVAKNKTKQKLNSPRYSNSFIFEAAVETGIRYLSKWRLFGKLPSSLITLN